MAIFHQLDFPNRDLPTPGVWFGINYQGIFGVDEAGQYEFELTSDDGAKLYVDDKLIVKNDGTHEPQSARGKGRSETRTHSIRVAYFQGPRVGVALVLLVKPPRKSWRLFDLRNFPPDSAAGRNKLPSPNE